LNTLYFVFLQVLTGMDIKMEEGVENVVAQEDIGLCF
jgi:hypothetical protein